MIYVTGDTHGLIDFAKLRYFAGEHPELTRADYVIIAGDFGGVWSEDTLVAKLRYYTELPFTVLFVDGNHENFDLLNTFPTEEWCGGKVRRIRDNVLHLTRGQVFTIEGKTFFTMGGGTSIDKGMRREGVSWWPQEIPSPEEQEEARRNLLRYGNKVDYVVTHSCGERALYYLKLSSIGKSFTTYPDNTILSQYEREIEFGHWFFGHYHVDMDLPGQMTAMCNDIVRIV